jgi:hypothetical protein
MNIVTPDFVSRMIRSGPLAQACRRTRDGTARPRNKAQWEKFSTWSLVCEEVLDTEHSDDWCDDIVAELGRRSFGFDQIDAMRRFAWTTAGWLNFDRVLWEWCSLDEKHIMQALYWQLREGIITRRKYEECLGFVERPASLGAADV